MSNSTIDNGHHLFSALLHVQILKGGFCRRVVAELDKPPVQQLQRQRQGGIQALLVLACTGCLFGRRTDAMDIAWLGYDRLALLSFRPLAEGLDGELSVASAVNRVRSDECRLHSQHLVGGMKPSSDLGPGLLHHPVLEVMSACS